MRQRQPVVRADQEPFWGPLYPWESVPLWFHLGLLCCLTHTLVVFQKSTLFFCLFFIFGSLFNCALVSSSGSYLLFCYKAWCVPGPVWSHWLCACLDGEFWKLFFSFLIVQYLIPVASLWFADYPPTTTTTKKKKKSNPVSWYIFWHRITPDGTFCIEKKNSFSHFSVNYFAAFTFNEVISQRIRFVEILIWINALYTVFNSSDQN